MKRIVFSRVNSVGLQQYELGELGKENIRVRHLYSLVSSGTEIMALTGKAGEINNIIPGYSAVGEVVDGFDGTPFQKGNLFFTSGSHEEYMDIPKAEAQERLIPVERSSAREATFIQLGKVSIHALHRIHIQLGDWVVVYGLGIVGNLSAQMAKAASGGKVIAVDPVASRRQIISEMGIITLDPKDPKCTNQIVEITGGGANAIVETSGSPKALQEAFKAAAYGAEISLVAGHYGLREVDLKTDFQNKELSLIAARRVDAATKATNYDRWTISNYTKEVYSMIVRKTLQIEPLISHVITPEEAPDKYRQLADGDETVLGVVIDWGK